MIKEMVSSFSSLDTEKRQIEIVEIIQSSGRVHQESKYITHVQREPEYYTQYSDLATGWMTKNCGPVTSKGKRFFSFPKHPSWLWGQPSLFFNGNWGVHIMSLKVNVFQLSGGISFNTQQYVE
jgi:hypothetical protein